MKRINLILGLLLMAVLPLAAKHVDPETARKVATTFLNNNGAKADLLTDLSKEAGFPNLYILNASPGYVVMAADDCVKPILGYSLTGKFEVEGMPENLKGWLQGYNDQIQDAIDHNAKASAQWTKEWEILTSGKPGMAKSTPVVSPLLSSKWNQNAPYNNLCPGGSVTGCVATAMAQIMYFWKYPAKGIGSHTYTHDNYGVQSADFNATSYDWTHMTDTYSSSSSAQAKLAVATLMYHCGVALEMDYSPSSSSAYSSRVAPSLINFFNYESTAQHIKREDINNDVVWKNMMRSELDAGRPIEYSGSGSGGHSFVCDGYSTDDYFHFNFGWGGYCDDANYTIDNLYPGPGGIGSGGGTYNNDQAATIGIQPSSCTAEAPSSLTFTQNNNTLTLQWTAGAYAISYNVYHDNILIGNTTATSFEAIAPYGSSSFYVRSVDASGKLSLSSNNANITIPYPTPIVNDLTAALADNNAALSWTTPEWCYPETPSATLTYGTQVLCSSYMPWGSTASLYWGHRYLSSNLSSYNGMKLYSVDFQTRNPGTYEVCVYTGTTSGTYTTPNTLVATQSITVTAEGWYRVDLDTPITIDASEDLWVFVHNPSYIDNLISNLCQNSDGLGYGCYYSSNPTSYTYNNISSFAFLIKTLVTDGTYTYNLYDGKTKVNGAVPIVGTSYAVNGLANNTAHQYTVTANYYGGESDPSNMVGVTLGDAEINELNLDTDDVMTVTSGSSLTVNGTLTNTNPAHLVIEDNAQLIHPGNAVQATLQKTIQAYSTDPEVNNGWYTIASPVNALGVDLATTGTYDLYTYDEVNRLWLNQEKPENNITQFNEGQGFLYANAAQMTLAFAGNMKATDEQITMPLSCLSSNENLKGINLVGNPFSRNLVSGDLTLGGVALTTYYSIEGGSELVSHNISTDPLKPGQGFLVQADANGQNLVFNPPVSKEETNHAFISIEATDGNFTDRAFVQFSEGNTLHKMTLGDNHVQISVRHDDANYAAINTNKEVRELPLYFKAAHNGSHTLSIDITNLELDYLHLVDNLTGADIDLLQNPSYSFEAKANDYTSRFKLVFNAETNDDVFGNDFVDGKTLILDMTGRVVATDRNAQLVPGVYILRTTNGNETHSKKFIIK